MAHTKRTARKSTRGKDPGRQFLVKTASKSAPVADRVECCCCSRSIFLLTSSAWQISRRLGLVGSAWNSSLPEALLIHMLLAWQHYQHQLVRCSRWACHYHAKRYLVGLPYPWRTRPNLSAIMNATKTALFRAINLVKRVSCQFLFLWNRLSV